LQDIAKVEYIPFETNRDMLMTSMDHIVHVSDNYILVANYQSGDVLVFDGKGKSIISFNYVGPGPMEYTYLYLISFDEKKKEIYIADWDYKILVYSEKGEFKRTLKNFPSDYNFRRMENFNDETLLVKDEYIVDFETNKYIHNRPYLLMSKNDGSIIDSLNINLTFRVLNMASFYYEIDGEVYRSSKGVNTPNNFSYGNDFMISDWGSDTIYKLTNERFLQPVIVKKPTVLETDPKIIVSNNLATDKFILLHVVKIDVEKLKRNENVKKKC
jgi:hypothetical protein